MSRVRQGTYMNVVFRLGNNGDCAEPFEREQPPLRMLTPFLKGVGNLIEMLTATLFKPTLKEKMTPTPAG